MSATSPVGKCPRLLAVLLIELLILFVGTMMVSCNGSFEDGQPPAIISAKAIEHSAFEQARTWKPDAFLSSVSIDRPVIVSPNKSANGTVVDFTFRSKEEYSESLSIDIYSNNKIISAKWPEFSPYRNYVPIESSDWPIDSKDAWQIAWTHGARTYILKYPTAAIVTTMKLERWDPPSTGPVRWYIFLSNFSNHDSFRLFVDGKTGDVVAPE
jgi:hypothetical protein